jgi:hypothetical protein
LARLVSCVCMVVRNYYYFDHLSALCKEEVRI